MANEVIGRKEKYILVTVDNEGRERPMFQDYQGNFITTDPTNVHLAKGYDDLDNAKKISDTLNLLYSLTNRKDTVYVVDEVIERNYAEEQPQEETTAQA